MSCKIFNESIIDVIPEIVKAGTLKIFAIIKGTRIEPESKKEPTIEVSNIAFLKYIFVANPVLTFFIIEDVFFKSFAISSGSKIIRL